MLQVRKSYILSGLLFLFYVYAFVPTESETSTFPMLVRTVSAILLMLVCLCNVAEMRFQFAAPVLFLIFYFSVLAAISFSFRYFVSLVVVLSAFSWALAYYQSASFRRAAIISLNFLIYSSVGFLVLQFLEFYLVGRLFDYHNLIFPWSEARLPLWSSLARVGGVYIEPGTYANWIYAFLLLRLFLDKNISPLLVPLISFTMIFSMSAWGVLVGVFVLLVYGMKRFDWRVIVYLLAAAVGVYIIVSVVNLGDVAHLLESRILYSGSREVRDDTFQEFLSVVPRLLVFGLGFGRVFCIDCQSPQDAGLIISLLVVYGLPFTLFVLSVVFCFAYRKGGFRFVILCFPLLNAKLFYWEHVFWFIFMVAALGFFGRYLYFQAEDDFGVV